MFIIPIKPETLNYISVLNEGVTPAFEDVPTYYCVYSDKANEIVSFDTLVERGLAEKLEITRLEIWV